MRVVVVRPRLLTHEFDPGGEEIAQQPARSPYSRQWMLLTGEYLQPHAAAAEGLPSMRHVNVPKFFCVTNPPSGLGEGCEAG
jgi:hypothetical protein